MKREEAGTLSGYELSDDPTRIDIGVVHRYLSEDSYWAGGRSIEVVRRSVEHSWCLGAYDRTGAMVAFARVVTDWATMYYLCDVFVLPDHRGHGLGKVLVKRIVDDPRLAGLAGLLGTADAHGLYEQFGFLQDDEMRRRFMRRPRS